MATITVTGGAGPLEISVEAKIRSVTGKPMSFAEKCVVAKIALYLRQGEQDKISPDDLAVLDRIYNEHRR